jgi:excisionase family DNA binding protein
VGQVAERLGISRRQVKRWLDTGKLAYITHEVGSTQGWRYVRESVVDAIEVEHKARVA